MNPETYQEVRQGLLAKLRTLSEVKGKLISDLPNLYNEISGVVREKFNSIDKDISRLQDPDLKVAFVGGFSAGKSSLINAFLGRYLLPESVEPTTAVPTFVRSCGSEDEGAKIHYLSQTEVEELGKLLREEVAEAFNRRDLLRASDNEFLNFLREHRDDIRCVKYKHFIGFLENKSTFNNFNTVLSVSIQQAKELVVDEKNAVFIDYVEFRVKLAIPQDIVLVDLPGVSVANPRHRKITFDFIQNKANAIVFVLLASRLFDRDETRIIEAICSGGKAIADKTFWVINKWDTLRDQQVNMERTLRNFQSKMEEFEIPANYNLFKTNALHGLIAQLANRGAFEQEDELLGHKLDYERTLEKLYGGSHDEALVISEIPLLQEKVFNFLNEEIRPATISSTITNAKQNFIRPLVSHLRHKRGQYDESMESQISNEKQAEIRNRIEEKISQRKDEVENLINGLGNDVAIRRRGIFSAEVEKLFEDLKNLINQDRMTDAFRQYLSIINGGGPASLRKFPYFFEIEIKIVDSLNSTLKTGFRRKIIDECRQIMEAQLTERVDLFFEDIRLDVKYELPHIDQLKKSVIDLERLLTEMEGVVKAQAFSLDELLVFKRQDESAPKQFFKDFFGAKRVDNVNQLIEALIEIAKIDSVTDNQVSEQNMSLKTDQIREVLIELYLPRVAMYRNEFIDNAWGLIIDHMRTVRNNLIRVVEGDYRNLLEVVVTNEVNNDLAEKRRLIDDQSRRLGQEIDLLESIESSLDRLSTFTS